MKSGTFKVIADCAFTELFPIREGKELLELHCTYELLQYDDGRIALRFMGRNIKTFLHLENEEYKRGGDLRKAEFSMILATRIALSNADEKELHEVIENHQPIGFLKELSEEEMFHVKQ